jgi:hypothetical protein
MYEAKPIALIMMNRLEDMDRIRIHSGTTVRCIDVPCRYSSESTVKARLCWLISDISSSSCWVFTEQFSPAGVVHPSLLLTVSQADRTAGFESGQC